MAYVSPTSASCPSEPHTGQGAYLKFEITSVSDSDAATNRRYVSWKITFQGTPWVQLFKAYATLGGSVIYNGEPGTTGWSRGTILTSDTTTFSNDSAGNLTLSFYMKQLFFYGTWAWNQSGYAQERNATFTFSQLPRYANFTSHTATSELNKITVNYAVDAKYKAQQYSLNGGAWKNTTAGSYNLTGLTPNTSYTIKTKIQRTDSNLWTESNTITIKTKALPTSIAPSNISFNKDGNTFTPSISSVDYLSGWYVIVKDGSTQVRSYSGNKSTTTSKTYTLQGSDFTAMLPRHTTTDNWNLTVQYKVISNGTTYTLTDRTFKCTIPAGQYLPTYNVNNLSYAVTDSKTLELNNNNATKVIKGVSSVEITSTAASPQGSASMSSYIASSGTKQKSGTTTTAPIKISLDRVDGSSFSVQAVDSRNRSTTATKDYAAFIDYFAPIVDFANITRVDAIGTNININIVGRYMNWSGLATSNTIEQVSIQYRIKGATSWTTKTGIALTMNVGNGNFTITGVITGNNFVATDEYELQLIFKDKIKDFIVLANIPVGDSLLWRDLANKRIGIGKKPSEALDVQGNAKVSGTINGYTLDYIVESNIFRNLLNVGDAKISTNTGLNFNNTNNQILINGSSTKETNIFLDSPSANKDKEGIILKAGKYTATIKKVSGSLANNPISFYLRKSNGTNIYNGTNVFSQIINTGVSDGTAYSATFTLTEETRLHWIGYFGSDLRTFNNLVLQFQIEESPTPTSYTPWAGYIVESGNNDNGSWVKFSDGTMICRGVVTTGDVSFTAWGSLYQYEVPSVSFPLNFIDVPHIDFTSNNPSNVYNYGLEAGTYQTTTSETGIMRVARPLATTGKIQIKWTAIGKWK